MVECGGGKGASAGGVSTRNALVDGHGRPINSIRISVNRECNLACFYCHNEGDFHGRRTMTPGEIEDLARLASDMGVRKLKLTGGEPLVRDDIVGIVQRVAPLFEEVSMTTNGVRLAPLVPALREAGLARVNISLNSLGRDRYVRICGSDHLDDVIAGIDASIEAGLTPVKLNMVLLKGINEDEVPDLLRFAAGRGAVLQIIELEIERERISSKIYSEHHADLGRIREWLLATGRRNGANPLHNRERYVLEGELDGEALPAPVEVELVMPMHNTGFCANCTRIRLTAGGYVKGCLFDRECVEDLLEPLREGEGPEELERRIMKVVSERKPYWNEADKISEPDNGGRGT